MTDKPMDICEAGDTLARTVAFLLSELEERTERELPHHRELTRERIERWEAARREHQIEIHKRKLIDG